MANKKYALAAWTEGGRLRMIPSLVNELSVPYREKIERLDGQWDVDRTDSQEIGWILTRSRAHEDFARFLLRVGYPKEAYIEYENAAKVCTLCSDRLWLQGCRGDFPVLPLYHRFMAMHRQCVRLADDHPVLKGVHEADELRGSISGSPSMSATGTKSSRRPWNAGRSGGLEGAPDVHRGVHRLVSAIIFSIFV